MAGASGSGHERPLTSIWSADAFAAWRLQMAFARGLTILRAHSMKRCAAGLMVRPFNVTIEMGMGRIGKSIGRAFSAAGLPLTRRIDRSTQ